jgi:hypothetical protein
MIISSATALFVILSGCEIQKEPKSVVQQPAKSVNAYVPTNETGEFAVAATNVVQSTEIKVQEPIPTAVAVEDDTITAETTNMCVDSNLVQVQAELPRILAQARAQDIKDTNMKLMKNKNVVYPDKPALASTNATFNYLALPVVLDRPVTADVCITYFAGNVIPVIIGLNDRIITEDACSYPSGWCAWNATNYTLHGVLLQMGTNTVKVFQRGNTPNILDITAKHVD